MIWRYIWKIKKKLLFFSCTATKNQTRNLILITLPKNTDGMRGNANNILIAKKASLIVIDVLWLIMLHNDNVDNKFQPSILNRSRENNDYKTFCLTEVPTFGII